MSRVQQAIEIIENCQSIHVNWADWQERNDSWRDEITPDSPGGPEHHREWVQKYDLVLDVLRNLGDNNVE